MRRVDSLEKILMLEGLGAGGEGDDRGWDGWMASLTWWTWAWVNSGSWWWTGRPGVLQFMGWQRVGHDWATEPNWSLYCLTWLSMWCSFTFCNHSASHFLFCHLGCPFYFESHGFPTIYFVWITLVKYGPPVTILHVAEQDPNAISGWVTPVLFKYILFFSFFCLSSPCFSLSFSLKYTLPVWIAVEREHGRKGLLQEARWDLVTPSFTEIRQHHPWFWGRGYRKLQC